MPSTHSKRRGFDEGPRGSLVVGVEPQCSAPDGVHHLNKESGSKGATRELVRNSL